MIHLRMIVFLSVMSIAGGLLEDGYLAAASALYGVAAIIFTFWVRALLKEDKQ